MTDFDLLQMRDALNVDSRFAADDRRTLDDALAMAAQEQTSTHPCTFRMRVWLRDIQAAVKWEDMCTAELAFYKGQILEVAAYALQTFPHVRFVELSAGVQACTLVEDMARRCMQFNDEHLLWPDRQMLMSRNIVPMMRPFADHTQEARAGIGWLYKRVTQDRHESQW